MVKASMANGQNGWMGLLPLVCHLIFIIGIIILVVILLRRAWFKGSEDAKNQ